MMKSLCVLLPAQAMNLRKTGKEMDKALQAKLLNQAVEQATAILHNTDSEVSEAPPVSELITHFTDVEGDLDHFVRAIELDSKYKLSWCMNEELDDCVDAGELTERKHLSPRDTYKNNKAHYAGQVNWNNLVLKRKWPKLEFAPRCLKAGAPPCHLVYGGDLFDHEMGDLRLVTMMIAFKRAHPDHVHMILGNREVSKIDWSRSDLKSMAKTTQYNSDMVLGKRAMELRLLYGDMDQEEARWDDVSKQDIMSLIGSEKAWGKEDRSRTGEEAQWGAGEVDRQLRLHGAARHMVNELQNGGLYQQYLELCQLVVRVGDTVFVHGSLGRHVVDFVPHKGIKKAAESKDPAKAAKQFEVDLCEQGQTKGCYAFPKWMKALNKFAADEIAEWIHGTDNKGMDLYMYSDQSRKPFGSHSVIDSRSSNYIVLVPEQMKTRDGISYDSMDETVARWLLASKVRRFVTGHAPTGQVPAVRTKAFDGRYLQAIVMDTNYAHKGMPDIHKDRACACLQIEMPVDENTPSTATIKGKLGNHLLKSMLDVDLGAKDDDAKSVYQMKLPLTQELVLGHIIAGSEQLLKQYKYFHEGAHQEKLKFGKWLQIRAVIGTKVLLAAGTIDGYNTNYFKIDLGKKVALTDVDLTTVYDKLDGKLLDKIQAVA